MVQVTPDEKQSYLFKLVAFITGQPAHSAVVHMMLTQLIRNTCLYCRLQKLAQRCWLLPWSSNCLLELQWRPWNPARPNWPCPSRLHLPPGVGPGKVDREEEGDPQ